MNVDAFADRVNGGIDDLGKWVDSKPPALMNRAVGLMLGLPSWTVIGIAAYLTPAAKGHGTHLQLGLGECTMLHITGYPCPMCGMTTTFTLFAHLRPIDAVLNQPFGVVLFSAALAAAVIGVVDVVAGVGLWRKALRWVDRREQRVASVLLFGMLGGWIYKIFLMHPELRFWSVG